MDIKDQKHVLATGWLLPIIYLALAVGTLVTFSGVVQNKFINYDDDGMIYDNHRVTNGLTRDGLTYAWTGPHLGNWHPLTTLSHQLDCELFGTDRPGLHHLVNLCLHTISVLLLFEALRRMTGDVWPSALVAALFAIHPLRVESVAWASERKDVLCALFWMLTLLAYVGYARRGGILRYLLLCFVFGLGLLAKPMLVTLPCVLLLLDFWPLRRWRGGGTLAAEDAAGFPQQKTSRLIIEKLPLLAAAAAVVAITAFIHKQGNVNHASLAVLPIPWRLANAMVAYVFYLWKTIWPAGLAVLYPHPGMAGEPDMGPWILPAIGAAVLLLAITGGVLLAGGRRPYFLVGWLWYLGTLVPVIGLIQVGEQAYADRYTYLPMIGIYIAIAWGARDLACRRPQLRAPLSSLAALWLVVLMVLTWRQVTLWRDSQTLFEHALRVTQRNHAVHNNLGAALFGKNQIGDAIAEYRKAIALAPDYADAHHNLGVALARSGKPEKGIEHLRAALRLKPDFAAAQLNLGFALQKQERVDMAIEHFRAALRLDPDFPVAHYSLGLALAKQGQLDEALFHFYEALRLKTDYAVAHFQYANALVARGRYDEAVAHYREAARLIPDHPDVHTNWGFALEALDKPRAAIVHFERALQLKKNDAAAMNNLAWLLATRRPDEGGDAKRAVELATQACRVSQQESAALLGTLAAAYASDQQFGQAVITAQKGIELALTSKDKAMAEKLKRQLERYQRGQPFWKPKAQS